MRFLPVLLSLLATVGVVVVQASDFEDFEDFEDLDQEDMGPLCDEDLPDYVIPDEFTEMLSSADVLSPLSPSSSAEPATLLDLKARKDLGNFSINRDGLLLLGLVMAECHGQGVFLNSEFDSSLVGTFDALFAESAECAVHWLGEFGVTRDSGIFSVNKHVFAVDLPKEATWQERDVNRALHEYGALYWILVNGRILREMEDAIAEYNAPMSDLKLNEDFVQAVRFAIVKAVVSGTLKIRRTSLDEAYVKCFFKNHPGIPHRWTRFPTLDDPERFVQSIEHHD